MKKWKFKIKIILSKKYFITLHTKIFQTDLKLPQHVDDDAAAVGVVPRPDHQLTKYLAVRDVLEYNSFMQGCILFHRS